jgi:hypothetical protein
MIGDRLEEKRRCETTKENQTGELAVHKKKKKEKKKSLFRDPPS